MDGDLLWISDPVRPRFLAITSSDLARSLSNFRTLHFSPSADFCQYLWSVDKKSIIRVGTCHCLVMLTRAPLGYFYNAPHWGGGGYFEPPPSDLRNYWTDSKNSSGIWKPWKNCRRKTNFIDLEVTSDITGQVKVKMFRAWWHRRAKLRY